MLLNEALRLPIRQSEVDFLIPNLSEDLQLYVDPFLLFKSGNEIYQAAHGTIHEFFKQAINSIIDGHPDIAKRMMAFPEVKETMLGLSSGSHRGRGMGTTRGEIIFNEIVSNDDILRYGITHLAEMQLLIEGVGFDMVSDMCTNIIKPFFVEYTQRQCRIHNIPMEKGLCLEHVFDWDDLDWDDINADLPINPLSGQPILLVPKNIVRRFEEIDYKDFWDTTYRYILREIEIKKSFKAIGKEPRITWKEINEKYNFCKKTVVELLHDQPDLKRQYLQKKEQSTPEDLTPVDLSGIPGTDLTLTPIQQYMDELAAINPGNKDAKKYESLIIRILTRLFAPHLSDPHEQVRTVDGREIIDITFYNSADSGFWKDMKNKHGSIIIPIELKNMEDIGNDEFFQLAARLNEKIGLLGILISRKNDGLDVQRAYRRFHNENKVLLILADEDIITMLNDLNNGLSPTAFMNRKYRKFVEEA